MRKIISIITICCMAVLVAGCAKKDGYRTITLKEYRNKMKAGWLGQMAGVGWGGPTEFKYNARTIPEDEVPDWKPEMLNQQYQDDIYVEMTFVKTLEDYGFDVSIRQAGIDFANSRYMLWHANKAGRDNLRAGIAPPYSGHPKYNSHADDIDYQIEADYSGLIAPGMPQIVIELAEKFGHIMNYGDGVYGGEFVGAMYSEAFFERDINKIIQAGLAAIPKESQYAEAINDVIKWHSENPQDWGATWQLIEDKYNLNPDYRKFSCNGTDKEFNIDAKINGAYIVMGLLYGEGDMDKTIISAMRCGMDSDCNPSNAAGILATSLGLENLPEKYKSHIDTTTRFSFTAYNVPALLSVCENLAKQAVVRIGGKVETNSDGLRQFVIPVKKPVISPLEQCWQAKEPTGDNYYTEEEMKKITIKIREPEEYVKVWSVAGPFSEEGVEEKALFDYAFAPEKDKKFADWKEMPVKNENPGAGELDLGKLFGTKQCVAYLKTNIWSKENQEVLFELGSDDGIKVWVNEELIHQNNISRGLNQGEDIVNVNLKKGWNPVLMKITQGIGGWGASLVITDKQHKTINDLKFK